MRQLQLAAPVPYASFRNQGGLEQIAGQNKDGQDHQDLAPLRGVQVPAAAPEVLDDESRAGEEEPGMG